MRSLVTTSEPPRAGTAARRRIVLVYGIVGLASNVAYLVLFHGLQSALNPLAANVVALTATTVGNTAAHRRYTFGVRGRSRMLVAQLGGFAGMAISLAVSTVALTALDALDRQPSTLLATTTLWWPPASPSGFASARCASRSGRRRCVPAPRRTLVRGWARAPPPSRRAPGTIAAGAVAPHDLVMRTPTPSPAALRAASYLASLAAPGALTLILVGVSFDNPRDYAFLYLSIVAVLGVAIGVGPPWWPPR